MEVESARTVKAQTITDKDRAMAQVCLDGCGVCVQARAEQKGPGFWFVKYVGDYVCPFCVAYEKVYGVKAHEPMPENVV